MAILLFVFVVVVVGLLIYLLAAFAGASKGKKANAPPDYIQARATLVWCSATSMLVALLIYLCLEGAAVRFGVASITVSLWLNIGICFYATALRQSALCTQRVESVAVLKERKSSEAQYRTVLVPDRFDDDKKRFKAALEKMRTQMGLEPRKKKGCK